MHGGKRRGRIAGQVVEQQQELVAAVAADGHVHADVVPEPGGDQPEQLIARRMPERRVDAAHSIDVDEHERAARRLPTTAGDGRLDAVGHRDAVW